MIKVQKSFQRTYPLVYDRAAEINAKQVYLNFYARSALPYDRNCEMGKLQVFQKISDNLPKLQYGEVYDDGISAH